MADYYPLLRKAVDALGRPGRDERYTVYERARKTVVNRLRGGDAPWSDADIDAQILALDDAVRRIESELDPQPASAVEPPVAVAATPVVEPADTPPARRRVAAAGLPKWVLGGAATAVLLIVLAAGYLAYRDQSRRPADPLLRDAAAVPAVPTKAQPQDTRPNADDLQPSYVLRKQLVFYRTTHPAGTIVISLNQRFLHVVQPNQVAIRYAIGVGPECARLAGLFQITDKVRQGETAEASAGPSSGRAVSVKQRYGPMALFFGERHAVHGTNEPARVGRPATYGCLHQWNTDIADLYERVALNERVVVAN
jgi:lipoprotein-anchoring transpeptidase ErfK/SrfK